MNGRDASSPSEIFDCADDGFHPRRLAAIQTAGDAARPGLFWLPGLRSDMVSTKASAVASWAAVQGLAMMRFDYSGHGRSDGQFVDGTIGLWLADARAAFARTRGPQIVIGSSMGGWIALRLLQAEPPERFAGLVLIAPAWDMTQALMWQEMSPTARAIIERDGVWLRPSEYSADGYPITRKLIEEGRRHLIAGTRITAPCPVRILHGRDDRDVPFAHGEALLGMIDSPSVTMTEVPDGDHRLSRPQDLALLTALIEPMTRQPIGSTSALVDQAGAR